MGSMNWALYAMAGVMALGALLTISSIGKPRKPVTPRDGAWLALTQAGWIALLILAAGRLS